MGHFPSGMHSSCLSNTKPSLQKHPLTHPEEHVLVAYGLSHVFLHSEPQILNSVLGFGHRFISASICLKP